MSQEQVSVIATVYNEIAAIDRLLAGLAAQSRRPTAVVVVDGGSTDGTWERLQAVAGGDDGDSGGDLNWPPAIPLRVISAPGANISAGRNLAIAAAEGPWIAATDAGVRLEPRWLERLMVPAEAGARWVAGFFASDPHGAFETALGAVTLPELGDIEPSGFLPSSRSVAFLRTDALAVGGYGEDTWVRRHYVHVKRSAAAHRRTGTIAEIDHQADGGTDAGRKARWRHQVDLSVRRKQQRRGSDQHRSRCLRPE